MGDPFLDRLDESYAPGWKPEPGDVVDGIVTDIASRDGGYGDYPIWTIRRIINGQVTADRVAVHAMHTTLANKGDEKSIDRGGRLAIRYNGMVASRKGSSDYHDYDVVFDPDPDPALVTAAGMRVRSAPTVRVQPAQYTPSSSPAPTSPAPPGGWNENEEPW